MGVSINTHKSLGQGTHTRITPPQNTTDTESMIFTITTPSDAFTFDLRGVAGLNNYDIDWGDGNSESGVTDTVKSHTYATAGLYEIKITGDIYIKNTTTTDSHCFTEWKQWGTAANVKSIREWFNQCINMTYTATDAPNFAFAGSTTYHGPYRLFYNCDSITSLDLSNWNTSAFTGATSGQTFQGMGIVTSINITGWNVTNITSAASWFNSVGNSGGGLTITAPSLNWSSCTSMSQFFYRANITSMNVSNWALNASGTNINQMFRGIGETISATGGLNLDLSTWTNTGAINTANGQYLFLTARGISTVNLTNWDFTSVTNFGQMFSNCYYLTDIIGLNTLRFDSATSMEKTFNNCYRIKFDTHNFHNDFGANWSVTTFSSCFYRSGYQLAAGSRGVIPNIVNWDMSNADNVYQMMRECKFEDSNQTFAPSSSWDLSGLATTDLELFAYNLTGIKTWDWSNVTIPAAVTSMSQFLRYVNATPKTLTTVIFGANCDFSGVTSWANAFNSQTLLTTLTFDSSVSFAAVTSMSSMLTSVPLGKTSYDNLLIRASATNTNTITLASASTYSCAPSSGATARAALVTAGWTITDGGCT